MLFSARDRGGAKPSSGVTSWGGCCGGVSLLWSARKRSSISGNAALAFFYRRFPDNERRQRRVVGVLADDGVLVVAG